ncbi:MAG: DUF5916 domain-containing protein [Cellvibrionaceae bacterium]
MQFWFTRQFIDGSSRAIVFLSIIVFSHYAFSQEEDDLDFPESQANSSTAHDDAIHPIDRISAPLARIPLSNHLSEDIKIRVDGKLDEGIWASLPTIGNFETVEPDTLAPGKYPTEMKIFYTAKGIYVGVDLHQPLDTLVGRLSSRDQRQLNRDAVFITFDTSSEARYGYWFGIALGGSLMDGTVLPERRYAASWDGPWRGATSVTDHGWSTEMFIPWSSMSMPNRDGARNIGVYMSRKVAHLNERWAWPALPPTKPQFMSVFDQLEVNDVALRQQYSIFPYASVTVDEVNDETNYKAGADLFWRPSTDFQLSATLNPDFGSVESDNVIVNLNATETFFPEKRLFFLEGQEVFIASPRATFGRPTTLLHTRRIGGRAAPPVVPAGVTLASSEYGKPAELNGALKATGEKGNFRYGLLTAMEDGTRFRGTDAFNNRVDLDQDGRNFGVGRVVYESSSNNGAIHSVGFMSTFVDHPTNDASVNAIDGHYLTSDGAWQWDGQMMYSHIDNEDSGVGGFLDGRYSPKQGITHRVELNYRDEDIDISDLGYFPRNDVIGAGYHFEKSTSDISFGRDAFLHLFLLQEWNNDQLSTKAGIFLDGKVTLDNLSQLSFVSNFFPARYDDLNSFGNGAYRIDDRLHIGMGYGTDSSKRLSANVNVRFEGENLGGHRLRARTALTYRPIDRLTTELSADYRIRDGWLLHQTAKEMTTFNAEDWTIKWNFDFFFTARQQLRASFQWIGIRAFEKDFYQIPNEPGELIQVNKLPGAESDDFEISNLNFQIRYRWEIAPMSDLFVVYTKNGYITDEYTEDFQEMAENAYHKPVSEQLVIKLRYRLGS